MLGVYSRPGWASLTSDSLLSYLFHLCHCFYDGNEEKQPVAWKEKKCGLLLKRDSRKEWIGGLTAAISLKNFGSGVKRKQSISQHLRRQH